MGKRLDTRKKVNVILGLAQEQIQGDYHWCQICGATGETTFAHSRKGFDPLTGDRWLPDDPEHPNYRNWFEVCFADLACHMNIEKLPHEAMYRIVSKIYDRDNREVMEMLCP